MALQAIENDRMGVGMPVYLVLPYDLLGASVSEHGSGMGFMMTNTGLIKAGGRAFHHNFSFAPDLPEAGGAIIGSIAFGDVHGGPGADTLRGNATADTIYGDAGEDQIFGMEGNDTLYGDGVVEAIGDAKDDVRGYDGNDVLYGGGGNDRLAGEKGNDMLYGGSGRDTLVGGAGTDRMDGGSDTDTASYVGSYASSLIVSLANPTINTGHATGDSYVSIENLIGSVGDDHLNGNHDKNSIAGNSGDDFLKSYRGNDLLTGGDGHDAFIFNSALDPVTNVDTILDFDVVYYGSTWTADDVMWLDNAFFTALATEGNLAAAAFKDMAGVPKDADDRIIYNSATGALYYDADGSGSAFGNVKFAVLTGKPVISELDFVVI